MTWVEGAVVCGSLAFYAAPVVLVVLLWLRRSRKKNVWLGLGTIGAFVLLVAMPLIQVIWLVPIDDHIRQRSVRELYDGSNIKWTETRVREHFGEPCNIRRERPFIEVADRSAPRELHTYTAWDYAPVRMSFFSHVNHFKIFFENGVVTGVNPEL